MKITLKKDAAHNDDQLIAPSGTEIISQQDGSAPAGNMQFGRQFFYKTCIKYRDTKIDVAWEIWPNGSFRKSNF